MPRILLVEDDRAILEGVTEVLRLEGFDVLTAKDGTTGLKLGLKEDVDLVVLDVRMPKMDGFEVCRRLRADNLAVPILFLTARTQETDKVLGLGLGADDYVTKPFSVAEFVARVKALLRRAQIEPASDGPKTFEFGKVKVDFGTYRVTRSAKEVTLTAREFALLRYLVRNRGKMITREDLLRDVWGYEHPPVTRTVDAHIAQLRKKLDDPDRPRHFTGVRSVGYRFEV